MFRKYKYYVVLMTNSGHKQIYTKRRNPLDTERRIESFKKEIEKDYGSVVIINLIKLRK